MMKKILVCLGALIASVAWLAAPVMAIDPSDILEGGDKSICDDGNNIPDELKEAAGCTVKKDDTVMPVAVNIINVVLTVVGILAVGIIIMGGVFYVISNGDAAKLQRAKNTILYGIVGLVISLLAFTIVTFISRSIWG